MEHYLNLNGDSGVTRYAIGRDFIRVQFRDPTIYVYDYVRPGKHHVDRMKELAVSCSDERVAGSVKRSAGSR